MEELEESKIEAVEELKIDQFERLLNNIPTMHSSQAPHDEPPTLSLNNVSTPPTRTPQTFSLNNVSTPPTRTPPTRTYNFESPKYEAPPFIYLLLSATANEELTSPTSNNNALQGTPMSNTEPIDYDHIINNAYDPNAPYSDSDEMATVIADETATVIVDTADLHKDNSEEDIANDNHNDIEDDLDDFFENQDLLRE